MLRNPELREIAIPSAERIGLAFEAQARSTVGGIDKEE
jgi:hypothetical protein